ncbi:conserved hypothetical protein [Trichormus variabilis ATCC 29413]|uniref:Uncharacterized protein n=2 Tax=Anabaena variabilis TaxID=264691 RepID=Q3MBT5_TRIV2|nr:MULTISPECIES: hypothetical protein [Nostocaceae]ABA21551.1 conserved hypothetical protein [Trichormus variabilis ATCC 29413]MBC1213911.1 hypothetical protein [Trichormus variabilis ARAD]MBC1258874.1 hypothetical protein [Trichormus variabilis V5]MBC1265990.1 hypothetical protein [Trichormus variabilis FSR]MBC1302061.1 hypothetical protein [Trichormus variabilis N2B]
MATATSTVSERESQAALTRHLNKSYYQDDQQVKLMNLQAEVDSLLEQLQNLKEQRLAATTKEE